MMDPLSALSPEAEKHRYDQHNNDIYDSRYRAFVKPLVNKINAAYNCKASCLDYGAGPGPVVASMLRESGYYNIELYDPHYYPDRSVLNKNYDVVICSEVIEHFKNPSAEFARLSSLLNPGGSIFCMTQLFKDDINFADWHYKNDPTHLFFYHPRALELIRNKYRFATLIIDGRVIIFTSPA